jgi:hypothetical protein
VHSVIKRMMLVAGGGGVRRGNKDNGCGLGPWIVGLLWRMHVVIMCGGLSKLKVGGLYELFLHCPTVFIYKITLSLCVVGCQNWKWEAFMNYFCIAQPFLFIYILQYAWQLTYDLTCKSGRNKSEWIQRVTLLIIPAHILSSHI